MHFKKISIVTISYNQSAFLREAIDSVLDQEYPNLEYIIVDPGSLDGSREIINEYSSDKINVFGMNSSNSKLPF